MCNRSLYRRCWRRWLRRQTAPPLGRGRVARLSSRRRLRAGCRGRRRSDCRSAGTGSSRRSHSRRRRAPRARLRGWRRPQGRRLGPSRRPSRRASPRGSRSHASPQTRHCGLGFCRRCPDQQRHERRRDDFRNAGRMMFSSIPWVGFGIAAARAKFRRSFSSLVRQASTFLPPTGSMPRGILERQSRSWRSSPRSAKARRNEVEDRQKAAEIFNYVSPLVRNFKSVRRCTHSSALLNRRPSFAETAGVARKIHCSHSAFSSALSLCAFESFAVKAL
jgi:hypothetical protein